MPKKIEDIVPLEKKSIRDIPIPVRRSEPRFQSERVEAPKVESPLYQSIRTESFNVPPPASKVRFSKFGTGKIWTVLVVLGLGLVFYSTRTGATVTYTPKIAPVAFANDTYSAVQNAKDGSLSFSVIKLSSERSVEVSASGEENVSEKARGTVTLYNKQKTPQQLVKTTRLEAPNGKIFRIQEDVTVPANGSLDVVAVADQAGVEYNLALSDFTLPGLKGTPRFELVYGRSKTEMTGGFVGLRRKVSENELTQTKEALKTSLKEDLVSQAIAQAPQDFVLFSGLTDIAYEEPVIQNSGQDKAKVVLKGNLSAVLFKRSDLAQYLAIEKLTSAKVGGEVDFLDVAGLSATMLSEFSDLNSTSTIKISLAGSTKFLYKTDEKALAQDLAGTSKKNIQTIVANYPSIEEVSVVVRPIWKSVFPKDPTKIKIESR